MRAAQGLAALRGREYVLPDDVKELVLPVLAHRVILSEEGRLAGVGADSILAEIVDQTPIPD